MGQADYEAIDVFSSAMRFHVACNFLRDRTDFTSEGHIVAAMSMPMLALSALCNELFLKTLHVLEGRPVPKTHNLAGLFRSLDRATRREIEAGWAGVLEQRSAMWRQIAESAPEPRSPVPDSLDAALESASRAFEAFRYSFQRSLALPDYFVDDLRDVLLRVAIRKEPHWATWSPGGLAEIGSKSELK